MSKWLTIFLFIYFFVLLLLCENFATKEKLTGLAVQIVLWWIPPRCVKKQSHSRTQILAAEINIKACSFWLASLRLSEQHATVPMGTYTSFMGQKEVLLNSTLWTCLFGVFSIFIHPIYTWMSSIKPSSMFLLLIALIMCNFKQKCFSCDY